MSEDGEIDLLVLATFSPVPYPFLGEKALIANKAIFAGSVLQNAFLLKGRNEN